MGKKAKISISQEMLSRATFEFYHFYGHAMASWASLESSLQHWFSHLTGMDHNMGSAIFFGARGFGARADMLDAAIQTCKSKPQAQIEFIKEAVKKARQYSSFRNKIAHGEPRLNVTKSGDIEDGGPVESAHYMLIQGKSGLSVKDPGISVTELNVAIGNIKRLRTYIISAANFRSVSGSKPPEECRALVLALPNEPQNKSDQIPEVPVGPLQHPIRRNKKAYRASKKKRRPTS
jgi:hypothetical protein